MGFAILGIAGWALIALAIVLTFGSIQRTSQGGKPIVAGSVIGILAVLGIVLNIIGNGLISIAQNERGLVRNLFTGVRLPTLEPGVHFVTPFVESVKRYSTGQDTYTMSKSTSEGEVKGDDSVTARTSDGQEVFIDASITFRPDGSKLLDLFTRFPQDDWKDVLVRPQARSIIYNRVAVYKVEEVYSTKREALQKQIEDDMRAVLAKNGLVLESFLMRNVTFNAEYAKSIEDKQIAQQNAERARFVVDQERQEAERVRVAAQGRADAAVTAAKAEAEAQVIRAKAEAEALSLVAAQLKDNPNLLTFRYIEKLSPGVQTIFLPANQPFLLDPKTFVGPQPQPTPAAQQPQQP
jgi:regulator of protease activity HflC (stomatin/prohibitin superfamily)